MLCDVMHTMLQSIPSCDRSVQGLTGSHNAAMSQPCVRIAWTTIGIQTWMPCTTPCKLRLLRLQSVWRIVRAYPSTALWPLLVLGVVLGLGIWGLTRVMAVEEASSKVNFTATFYPHIEQFAAALVTFPTVGSCLALAPGCKRFV